MPDMTALWMWQEEEQAALDVLRKYFDEARRYRNFPIYRSDVPDGLFGLLVKYCLVDERYYGVGRS